MSDFLKDLAPYPTSAGEASAEALAKNLACYAHINFRQMLDLDATNDQQRQSMGQLVNLYGVVSTLRAFHEAAPDAADKAAADLWTAWDAGDSLGEWLWEWLSGWGIDPDRVIEAADRVRADAATS